MWHYIAKMIHVMHQKAHALPGTYILLSGRITQYPVVCITLNYVWAIELTKSLIGTYTSALIMATSTQYLRLLLIIAIVLSPVQPLFAMQADNSTSMMATTSIGDTLRNDMSKMLDNDCDKQGKCSHCQAASHCSSCPLSLGISQITSKCVELNARVQPTVSDVSLHSTDLLPDYRPPRYS